MSSCPRKTLSSFYRITVQIRYQRRLGGRASSAEGRLTPPEIPVHSVFLCAPALVLRPAARKAGAVPVLSRPTGGPYFGRGTALFRGAFGCNRRIKTPLGSLNEGGGQKKGTWMLVAEAGAKE